jgi:hypothetical protein
MDEEPMATDQIRAQIQDAWNEELEHQTFASLIRSQLAKRDESSLATSTFEEREQMARSIVESWRVQLEQVPDLIDAVAEAAAGARVYDAVAPILDVAESYFFDAEDLLSDSLGMLGLMDDMYLSLSLLQSVSEQFRGVHGHPLIDADLEPSIRSVRALFQGKRLEALDASIEAALCRPGMLTSMKALASLKRPLAVTSLTDAGMHAGADELEPAHAA